MNRRLAEKITHIAFSFEKARQELPIAQTRDQIKPIYCGRIKGVRVHNRNVWGVSAREWWRFCKCVN